MSEVGRKVSDQLTDLTHQQWIDHCHLSVDAGANLVILESRESGLSGYVSAEGHINKDLIDSIVQQIVTNRFERVDLTGNKLGEKGGGALGDRLNDEMSFVKHIILSGEDGPLRARARF